VEIEEVVEVIEVVEAVEVVKLEYLSQDIEDMVDVRMVLNQDHWLILVNQMKLRLPIYIQI
jgi:hypothetical protein